MRKTTSYEIDLRLDDGTRRTVTQDTPPPWQPGDRVRLEGNAIHRIT